MTAKRKVRRATDFLLPAADQAAKYYAVPKADALADIDYRRLNSINPAYWDDVERFVINHHHEKKQREKEIEDYYHVKLSDHEIERAERVVSDLIENRTYAYEWVNSAIDNAPTEKKRRFFMYIKRLLNQHFYGGA